MELIRCTGCGQESPRGARFCKRCGKNLDEENFVYGGNNGINQSKKSRNRIILILTICVIALAAVVTTGVLLLHLRKDGIMEKRKEELKQALKKDWEFIDGDEDSYVICILDFSENEIEYRVETGFSWMDSTLATFEYKVVSGDKIKVKRYGNEETFTIEFNDDKSMMTVRPALTSVDDVEYWFNFD